MKYKLNLKFIVMSSMMMFTFISQGLAQENTKVEKAEKNFCNSVTSFIVSLEVLDEANDSSSMDEFNTAYKKADKAYNKMIKSADKLENVEVKESVKAYNKLVNSINKIEGDTKTAYATDQINSHIDTTTDEISDILTVICK